MSLPRAILVGRGRELAERVYVRLRDHVDLEAVEPRHVASSLSSRPADLLLVDADLPAPTLRGILRDLPDRGSPVRPTVVLLVRRQRPASETLDVDDLVDLRRGNGEIVCRILAAIRVRGYLTELSRKNAELAELSERLSTLARRMADELRLAANVQRSLLPPPLNHPQLEVAREFMPFREIGGDFYDLVPLSPSRVALGIGDVMGKGVPAALLAANLKACLRAQLHGELVSVEMMERVNGLFHDVSPRGQFATLFFGVFDLESGRVDYVNAGHDYPFVVRACGHIEDLTTGGPVLGLLEHVRYEQGQIDLTPGDLVVLYSDGVTDRDNDKGEAYGAPRLKDAALRCRADCARIVLYSLLGEVQGWCAGAPATDDMTLVVAKRR